MTPVALASAPIFGLRFQSSGELFGSYAIATITE